MKIKIVNESGFPLPEYKTKGSAGMDLRSIESALLKPGERKLIDTGISTNEVEELDETDRKGGFGHTGIK